MNIPAPGQMSEYGKARIGFAVFTLLLGTPVERCGAMWELFMGPFDAEN